MLELIISKILSILIGLSLFGYSNLLKKISGNIHTPGSLYSLYWSIIIIIPNIFLYFVPINPLPLIFILFSAFAFSISGLLYDWKRISNNFYDSKLSFRNSLGSNFLRLIFFVSFICAILFPILMLEQNGFSIELFLVDWIKTSSTYATSRSTEDNYEYGIIGQLSTFFPLFVSAIGGAISSSFCTFKKRINYFILSMLPAFLFMLTHSSKILFLYSFLFYLSVIVTFRLLFHNKISFGRRYIKLIFYFGILFFPLFIFSFKLRDGYNDDSESIILSTILSYVFGSIFAFSDFFSSFLGFNTLSRYVVEDHYTFGYYTFKSLFDFFGGSKYFPPGYYYDFYSHDNFIQTNIFTIFRQLIQDFSVFGSIIFLFFLGFLVNLLYFMFFKLRYPYLMLSLLVLFFVFLGMSQMFSIFTNRLCVFVSFAFYIILRFNTFKLFK